MLNKAKKFKLKERAHESCRLFLKSEDSLPNGWLPEKFGVEFRRCSLVFEHAVVQYPFFETELLLDYDGNEVGRYRLITSVDGEDLDDYLEFYQLS